MLQCKMRWVVGVLAPFLKILSTGNNKQSYLKRNTSLLEFFFDSQEGPITTHGHDSSYTI